MGRAAGGTGSAGADAEERTRVEDDAGGVGPPGMLAAETRGRAGAVGCGDVRADESAPVIAAAPSAPRGAMSWREGVTGGGTAGSGVAAEIDATADIGVTATAGVEATTTAGVAAECE